MNTPAPMTVLGVPGRLTDRRPRPDGLWSAQAWRSERRQINDAVDTIVAKARFDDSNKNGHNTFAITCDIYDKRGRDIGGGAAHGEIAKAFPELAPLIRWHLVSTDGPLHYVANTVYHAGDRDPAGRRAGEPTGWQTAIAFGANPIRHRPGGWGAGKFVAFLQEAATLRDPFDFEVIRIDHDRDRKTFGPKFTFGGYGENWADCPFDTEQAALDFLAALRTCGPRLVREPTGISEGKPRELDAARRAAIWPDATDEQLSAEPADLTAALEARLPALLADFRADMERAGFAWSPADLETA